MSSFRPVNTLRRSLFIRPAVFVVGGVALCVVTLAIDASAVGALIPSVLHFSAETARTLLGTMAGAMLTLAGITFWVRAASVQLAAGQFSNRVVHGFLEDWFQQSIMGLLLGIFAYIIGVFRVIPAASSLADTPQLSVNLALGLAGGSVLVILHAIRNAVQSMQVDQLARRITDETVERIALLPPLAEAMPVRDLPPPPPPLRRGTVIRATASGWVHRLDETGLLARLPGHVTVRLEVRAGLFVLRGRPVCTVWGADLDAATVAGVRSQIRLGRNRPESGDIESGIQQLVDLVVGSLSNGLSDTTGAHEVLAHVEMVLAELSCRQLASQGYTDERGRLVLRAREFTWSDYVRTAFDRLRRATGSFPEVTVAMVTLLGTLARDLEAAGHPDRAAPVWRQMRMAVEASEAGNLFADDLESIREAAERQRTASYEETAAGTAASDEALPAPVEAGTDAVRPPPAPLDYAEAAHAGSSASPSAPVNPLDAAELPRVTT
ncbi:MAG: DUF2254 domain-containing protein [Egibacteraceae bacterium]